MAVPRCQHSPMFGHAASWQTVWRFSDSIRPLSSRYLGLPGAGTLNHGGLRARSGRTSGPRMVSTFWFPPGLALDRVAIPPKDRGSVATDWNTASHTCHVFLGTITFVPRPGRETDVYGGFLDQALAELSTGQHGPFRARPARGARSDRAGGSRANSRRPPPPHPPHRLLHGPAAAPQARRACTWRRSSPAARARSSPTARPRPSTSSATGDSTKIDVTVPRRSGAGTTASRSMLDDAHRARRHGRQQHPLHDRRPHPPRPRRGRHPAPARAGLRPGRDRPGARPQRHPGPARPQPHSPRCQSRSSCPRNPLHRQDAHLERERGGAAGDHPTARHPRPGHQPVRDPQRRRPRHSRRLRLARSARHRRGRQRQMAQHAPEIRDSTVSETSG